MGNADKLPPLSEAQTELLNILWDKGECSVIEVLDVLKSKRAVARNTVQTMLTRLEDKGWLTHREASGVFYFKPTVTREQSQQRAVSQLLDNRLWWLSRRHGARLAGWTKARRRTIGPHQETNLGRKKESQAMNVLHQWLLMVALQSTILLIAFLILLRWWSHNPFSRHILSSAAITTCMLLPLAICLVQRRSPRLSARNSSPSKPTRPVAADAGRRSSHLSKCGLRVASARQHFQPGGPATTSIAYPSAQRGTRLMGASHPERMGHRFLRDGFRPDCTAIETSTNRQVGCPVAAPEELIEHLKMVFGRPLLRGC